jgi:hypothetical protein
MGSWRWNLARQLRCHWLKNPAVRASLFYVHIATQVSSFLAISAVAMMCLQKDSLFLCVSASRTHARTHAHTHSHTHMHTTRTSFVHPNIACAVARAASQVTGLIITTVGFIIATRLFGIKYDQVAFSHGRIGVAILVLIYSQVRSNLD